VQTVQLKQNLVDKNYFPVIINKIYSFIYIGSMHLKHDYLLLKKEFVVFARMYILDLVETNTYIYTYICVYIYVLFGFIWNKYICIYIYILELGETNTFIYVYIYTHIHKYVCIRIYVYFGFSWNK